MYRYNHCWHMKAYLHSNLVIFKFQKETSDGFDEFVFTFQSGDIQIKTTWKRNSNKYPIYIPIWWYSNLATNHIDIAYWEIYIPIWWYSNIGVHKHIMPYKGFTFQSGDIQIISFLYNQAVIIYLHSNLVIFKCYWKNNIFYLSANLHSNLVIFK